MAKLSTALLILFNICKSLIQFSENNLAIDHFTQTIFLAAILKSSESLRYKEHLPPQFESTGGQIFGEQHEASDRQLLI